MDTKADYLPDRKLGLVGLHRLNPKPTSKQEKTDVLLYWYLQFGPEISWAACFWNLIALSNSLLNANGPRARSTKRSISILHMAYINKRWCHPYSL